MQAWFQWCTDPMLNNIGVVMQLTIEEHKVAAVLGVVWVTGR